MAQTLACYAACTTLQIGADTEAHGACPSVIQLSCRGCPYVAEGCERAVGCPSANNAGKVSWLSMESNRKLSCVMTSFERLHGSLSFCRARNELFKNSFFFKELIIHRLHDKLRLSFNSSLAIQD